MNTNRISGYIGQERRRQSEVVHAVRAAVTCLLHDEGGWWSPSCVRSAAALPDANPPLMSLLVRAALAELAHDGRVEAGFVKLEPVFRWIQ